MRHLFLHRQLPFILPVTVSGEFLMRLVIQLRGRVCSFLLLLLFLPFIVFTLMFFDARVYFSICQAILIGVIIYTTLVFTFMDESIFTFHCWSIGKKGGSGRVNVHVMKGCVDGTIFFLQKVLCENTFACRTLFSVCYDRDTTKGLCNDIIK